MDFQAANPMFKPKSNEALRLRRSWNCSARKSALSSQVSLRSRCLPEDLTQQDGNVHAGIITTVAELAAGYADFSLIPQVERPEC